MLKPKKIADTVPITEEQKERAEKQIVSNLKVVDYDTKEYPVEVLVSKYREGLETDENELFIPDYQRDFVWSLERQSKFIESILIGLPIPSLFTADVTEKDARMEMVDGSQRLRTLAAFHSGDLKLVGLQKLTELNGLSFSDLSIARQRRFRGRPLRTIVLSEKADEEVRRDIFERINTGSDELNFMEVRRGVKPGPFLEFVKRCATDERIVQLAPLSEFSIKRREHEEFILRYFAYADGYQKFNRSVREFVDSYFTRMDKSFDPSSSSFDFQIETRLWEEFDAMLGFVERHFPHGFAKKDYSRTPRIRFEAIAVGTTLALRVQPALSVSETNWTESPEFLKEITSDASNSRRKVIQRIEFVRDALLNAQIEN